MHIQIEVTVRESLHSWPELATQKFDIVSDDVLTLIAAADALGAPMERLILCTITTARNELAKREADNAAVD